MANAGTVEVNVMTLGAPELSRLFRAVADIVLALDANGVVWASDACADELRSAAIEVAKVRFGPESISR